SPALGQVVCRCVLRTVAVFSVVLTGSQTLASENLPIFDTHVHYSEDAWGLYAPSEIIDLLARAGVSRALVSSTPDDGTLLLYQQDPDRVVPILRPYRSSVDMSGWFRDKAVMAYVEKRLKRAIYRGVGEFHIFGARDVDTPQMRWLVKLAVERNLVLHMHSDAEPVRALYAIGPKVKILWAHAGVFAPPDVIGELLDRYPTLSVELSLRAADVAPGGALAPAWRELLLRHADRFMIGTDTWASWRWTQYTALVREHRRWLAQLPRPVAEKIAYRNAARHFATAAVGAVLK
ncbi:MAG: amidohydrolase family protein, partial [Acidiferrobacterales bacterium]